METPRFPEDVPPATWVAGKRRHRLGVAWWMVQAAREQGWSVWWVDGENDLVAENRWLNLALDNEVPLARLVDGDKNRLPGHSLLDLQQQPADQTLSWWRQLLMCQEGREPTQEELTTWVWRQEGVTTPLVLEPKLDARKNEQVSTLLWESSRSLGHMLPEVLLSQAHMLWVASHFGASPRLDTWLSWLLAQHREQDSAPPVLVVMTGDKLEGPRQLSWPAALAPGRIHLLYLPTKEPSLGMRIKNVGCKWQASEGVSVVGSLQGKKWVLPAEVAPPMREADWPRFADWKTQFTHHHLTSCLEKAAPMAVRSSRL